MCSKISIMRFMCLVTFFILLCINVNAQKQDNVKFIDANGYEYSNSFFKKIKINNPSGLFHFYCGDNDYTLIIELVDDKPIVRYIKSGFIVIDSINDKLKGQSRFYTIHNPKILNGDIISSIVNVSFYEFNIEKLLKEGDPNSEEYQWYRVDPESEESEYYGIIDSPIKKDTVIVLNKPIFGSTFTSLRNRYTMDFMFKGRYPEVSYRKLTDEELSIKTKQELRIMRNELFARYGHEFKKGGEMDKYFRKQDWYYPYRKGDDVSKQFSFLERMNLKKIMEYEKLK